jgi:hypothetical protein
MTRLNAQAPHLTASVVMQKNEQLDDASLDALMTEGLAVLAKAISVFTNGYTSEVSYEVEVLVQEDAIVLKGRVVPEPAPTPKIHLSIEEMQALFEINA